LKLKTSLIANQLEVVKMKVAQLEQL